VNDAWFGLTSQPELHDLSASSAPPRAVDRSCSRPNTGPSWIVDARGRVVARTARTFEPDLVSATVHVPGGLTLSRRAGDLAWAVPLLLLVLCVIIRDLRDVFSHPTRRPRRVPRRALRDDGVLAQEARP
jgi:apolipoprotein N-acyltransferase